MLDKKDYMSDVVKFRESLYKNPQLKMLFFELTDCCNLSCRHCGSKCSPKNATYLDKNLIYKVLREVKQAYRTSDTLICITGGEPMLHPDFFEIIKSIDEIGFRWGMTTNATLIDSVAAEKIIDAHMTSVSYSIDGTMDLHNFLRSDSLAYNKCINGINTLQKYKNHFVSMITTVVHKQNIDDLDEIYELVKSLGVDSWRLTNVDPIGRAINCGLLLNNNEYYHLFNYIDKLRNDLDCPMEVTYGCSHYLGEEYEGKLRKTYFLCGAGLFVGSVCSNGDIYACLDIERLPCLIQGNVKEDSFVEVWENKFNIFRQNRALLNKECKKCDGCEFCAGDSAHTWNYEENYPKFCIKKEL